MNDKKSMENNDSVWDVFFRSKFRSYLSCYIVMYLFVTIYSCLRYNRPIIYNFFPIKLCPLVLARNFGMIFYKSANREGADVEKFKKEFKSMTIIVVVIALAMVALYKITGVDLLWVVL